MFAFTFLCVSLLVSLIHATPLTSRDVFSPHITSPNEKTIWPVGTKQTVTWETKDIPPDSQLTNPNGKVVLGHLGPDGALNLQLDNPLAQNFRLRLGKVDITVPSVPPRDDYIIVLFGDSGNASPAFAITRITDGSSSTASTTKGSTKPPASSISPTSIISTPITEPIPITGTTITGGESSASNQHTTTVDFPSSSGSAPPQSTQLSPTSSIASTSGTSAPASATNNSASAIRRIGSVQALSSIGAVSFLLVLFA